MAAGGAAVASAVLTGTLFAQAAPPPAPPHPVVPPTPLKTVAVPRPDLSEYVVNNAELVVLGKALFWDMQAGGDGVQACASCHFHAGADNRATNTLNGGANSVFSVRQAGETLQTTDFPFHKLANPEDARSVVVRDSDDVVGSQGVFKTHFDALGYTMEELSETLSQYPNDFESLFAAVLPTFITIADAGFPGDRTGASEMT